MKRSKNVFFLSLVCFGISWWLTKDAPIVRVGNDLTFDSPFWWVGYASLAGFAWSGLLRVKEIELSSRRRLSREKDERRQTMICRNIRQIVSRWSAETGIPQ